MSLLMTSGENEIENVKAGNQGLHGKASGPGMIQK